MIMKTTKKATKRNGFVGFLTGSCCCLNLAKHQHPHCCMRPGACQTWCMHLFPAIYITSCLQGAEAPMRIPIRHPTVQPKHIPELGKQLIATLSPMPWNNVRWNHTRTVWFQLLASTRGKCSHLCYLYITSCNSYSYSQLFTAVLPSLPKTMQE